MLIMATSFSFVFHFQLKEEAEPYNNELELDVYLKLFGTDALYLSFGDDKSFDFHQFMQKQLQLGDSVLDKLKNFQVPSKLIILLKIMS